MPEASDNTTNRLAGSTGRHPDWTDLMIATLRAKVAKDRGVDPESLEAEVVNVGQEDGKGFIDIRFTTKETTTAPDAVMSAMETETSPLPDAVAAAWSVEQDPPTVEVHRPRR